MYSCFAFSGAPREYIILFLCSNHAKHGIAFSSLTGIAGGLINYNYFSRIFCSAKNSGFPGVRPTATRYDRMATAGGPAPPKQIKTATKAKSKIRIRNLHPPSMVPCQFLKTSL
jgi:hypothetical protein